MSGQNDSARSPNSWLHWIQTVQLLQIRFCFHGTRILYLLCVIETKISFTLSCPYTHPCTYLTPMSSLILDSLVSCHLNISSWMVRKPLELKSVEWSPDTSINLFLLKSSHFGKWQLSPFGLSHQKKLGVSIDPFHFSWWTPYAAANSVGSIFKYTPFSPSLLLPLQSQPP